ncbi:MAG: hypothetical protein JW727_05505 [Candidatus Aenigmarchaeota archaeon]|nr:hypothetical protein [Candidatus Aenigmarchaeota archaeon]
MEKLSKGDRTKILLQLHQATLEAELKGMGYYIWLVERFMTSIFAVTLAVAGAALYTQQYLLFASIPLFIFLGHTAHRLLMWHIFGICERGLLIARALGRPDSKLNKCLRAYYYYITPDFDRSHFKKSESIVEELIIYSLYASFALLALASLPVTYKYLSIHLGLIYALLLFLSISVERIIRKDKARRRQKAAEDLKI